MAASFKPVEEPLVGTSRAPWATRDGTMTSAQASYLRALCEEICVEFDPGLTKDEAFQRINELESKTARNRELLNNQD